MQRFTPLYILAGSALLFSSLAFGDSLPLTIDNPVRTVTATSVETYLGTVTNNTGSTLDLSSLGLNFSGYEPSQVNLNQSIVGSFALAPGEVSAVISLFTFSLGPDAPPGTYLADVFVEDLLGNISEPVTVSETVTPEPSSLALLLAAFVGMFVLRIRKRWWKLAGAAALFCFVSLVSFGQASPVQIGTGQPGVSVWQTGTISVAMPIVNVSEDPASNVVVNQVSMDSATLISSDPLPLTIGVMTPSATATINAQFTAAVPGTYVFHASGTYQSQGATFGFAVNRPITAQYPVDVSVPVANGLAVKQITIGALYPPAPVAIEEQDNNRGGPPVPIGQPHFLFPLTPTGTGASPANTPGASVTYYRDNQTGQTTLAPPDPTAAAANGVVFATANTYALFSADDGVTFTTIDPTTIFPQDDGGLCCDQVATYVPQVNLFFWLLQYKRAFLPTDTTVANGPSRLRIAYATPESMKANITAWTYVDLQSSTFNLGNQWLDFPDLAFTNGNLYASVDRAINNSSVSGLIVSRMSLGQLADPAVTTVGVQYCGPNELSDQSKATGGRLVQDARDRMYWAGQTDTSSMEVFQWLDSSDSVSTHNISINSWSNSDYSSLAEDKQQWIDSSRAQATGAITGGTRVPFSGLVAPGSSPPNGRVWLAWGAGKNNASRPQPYVILLQIDDQTLDPVGQYDIWNSNYAFAYAALATSNFGNGSDIGVSLAFGGGGNYATNVSGYINDYVVYYNGTSDVTQTLLTFDSAGNTILDNAGNPALATRYGDYHAVRSSGSNGQLFSTEGYTVNLVNSSLSKTCTVAPGCQSMTRYEQFGRPPAPPVVIK